MLLGLAAGRALKSRSVCFSVINCRVFFLSLSFLRVCASDGIQVKLERVLGLTVTSNAALACDPNTGTIAYPAGYVTFLLSPIC